MTHDGQLCLVYAKVHFLQDNNKTLADYFIEDPK